MYQSYKLDNGPHRNIWQYLWLSQDIRNKILITLGLIIIYRFLLNIPLPGIATTPEDIQSHIPPGSSLYTLVEFLSILSGSSLLNISVLSLGLLPFNLTGVLLQLYAPMYFPSIALLMKRDRPAVQHWLRKWNYYLAIPVAVLESFLFLFIISPNCEGRMFLLEAGNKPAGILFTITTVILLVAGSFFAVWIAGLISEFGIKGQGNAILIASGIIGQLPNEFVRLLKTEIGGSVTIEKLVIMQQLPQKIWYLLTVPETLERLIAYVILFVGCIIGVIYLHGGKRRIPIIYPHRSIQTVSYPWQNSNVRSMPYLPLTLTIGVDGLIGSQLFVSLTTFYAPLIACTGIPWVNHAAIWIINIFGEDSMFFGPIVFVSVVAFTFFYADMKLEEQNYGQSLHGTGAHIPGVHSGVATDRYLSRINRRITIVSAMVLGLLAIVPWMFGIGFGVRLSLLDGEKILIIVGVIWDVIVNINAELRLYGYQDRLLMG